MTEYEKFLNKKNNKIEKQTAKSHRLSAPDSKYQTFLKNREKKLEEENDFARYLKEQNKRAVLRENLDEKHWEREDYLNSEDNVGLWDAMTTDKTMDDWKRSREWKKQNQKEIDEAAAQVAAYEQFVEDKKFQSKTESMSSADIDNIISDYDSQIAELENSKVGWFEAMKPGGVTPSERKAQKEQIDSEIMNLQNEQGKYRAIRDEKKSREMTEDLPADVVMLLDEFNNLVYEEEGADWAGVASGFTGSGSGGNAVQRSSADLRIQQIKTELTERGYDNFIELAEYRKYITDKEAAMEQEEIWAEVAEEHPVLASVGARATGIPAAAAGMYGTIKQYENTADFIGGTPYSAYYTPTRARQTIDNTISEGFEDDEIFSAKAKRFLYGATTSAADSAIASMSGGSLGFGKLTVGETILGIGAANDTLVRAYEKGMTQEQAMKTAAVAMASEIAFEHLSIGKLGVFESTAEQGIKNIAKNAMKESFVNMTEEMATEITNITFDYYYNGGLSDYYQTYENYVKQGMTEEEAKKAAAGDMAMQVVEAGASGAMIGGVFSGAQSVGNKIAYDSAMYEQGRSIAEGGAVESELAAAAELGANENDAIYKFIQEAEAYQQAKNTDENYEGTKKQYRSIGRLSEGLDTFAQDKIKTVSSEAIHNRLTALGEKGDVEATAKVVQKVVQNRGATDTDSMSKLSRKERQILKNSPQAQRVLNEISGSRYFNSDGWNTKRAESIDNIVRSRQTPDIEAYRNGKTAVNAPESDSLTKQEEQPYGFENYEKRVKESVINEGQDKERFDADFELFKQYGEAGRDFEQVKSNSTVSKDFTEVQMKAAYDLGREKAEAQKMTVLKGIQKVEGGEVYVTDTQDNVRKLSEVNTDENTRKLFKSAAKYDTDAANLFVQGYNRSASLSSYRTAFNTFYSAGTAGQRSFAEVMKENNTLVRYMADKAYAKKAFELGRQERLTADKAVKQKKQTGEHPAKGEYQNRGVSFGEEAVDEFYTAVSKKLGINIVRTHRIETKNGQVANAQYDPTKHKMTVSEVAENEWQAGIHELTHAAFAYNTEKMKEVKKAVIDWFVSQNSESEFEEILHQYGASYEGDSRADIEEEFVADAIGGMFSTEEGVQDFLNWLQNESGYNAKEKKTILQRITEWLSDIIEAIRDIMNSGELNGAVKLFAKENCDELTKIRKMFLEALDGVEVNYHEKGAVEGDVRNSFAGIKAKTSNIQTFEAAQRLEDVGKATPEEIRQQTGWFRGYDGMWRFEIDDSKMVIRDTDIRSGETKLSEVLDYPQLFEAYPQLKDVTISAFPSMFRFGVKGSYNSERNEISLSDEFLVDAKVHRELEALKKSEEYKAYKERLEGAAREHGEKRLKLSREFKKIREAKLYTDMVDLLYQLDDEGKVEEYKKAEKEWQNSALGKRYDEIKAELKRMDEVNPQSEIEKAFRESELGKRYHELTLDVFSGGDVINDKDTRNTLIHEIQHAIQHIEGFASGASPKYWKDINTDPFSYTPSEIKRLEKVRNEAYSYLKMLEDEDIREDAQRYWYLNDHYFDDNLDTEGVDKEIAEIEARAEAFGYQDKLDRYFELENKVTLTFNEIERRRKRAPDELYQNTAGEIEARDATARLTLTAEERKNTRPDIDRKDVVFSDGGVSWMSAKKAKYDPEIASISEQIRNSQSILNSMDVVGEATAPQVFKDKYEAGQWAISQLKAFGYQVDRQNFGKIYFGESDIKDGINYADTNAEKAALILIPKVLKRGIEIGHHGNHKLRQKETITFAGPVILNGIRGNMAVVVNMHGNKYSVHRILLPDGSSFKFSEKNNEVKQESYQGVTENSSLADTTSFTSVNSIPNSTENVKYSLKNSLDWVDWDEDHISPYQKSLAKKITELEKINEDLRIQLRHPGQRHIINLLETQRVMRELVSGYMSRVDRKKVTTELYDLYTLMANDIAPAWEVIDAHMENIADMILQDSKYMKPEISEERKAILRDMKGTKIKLSDMQKSEVASQYGSYNRFRQTAMGTLVLSNEGIELDSRWKELSETYPQYFSEDIAEPDQPAALMEIAGILRNTYEDDNGFDYDSAKDFLKTEIYEKYFEVPETKLLSQEYQAKLNKAKNEYSERLKEAKTEFAEQKKEALKTARNEYDAKLKMTRDKLWDTRAREKKRNRLIKTVKRLDRLLRNPGKGAPSAGTNKYGQEYVHLTNIPEGFKKAVIDFCYIFIENDAGVFTAKYKDSEGVVREKVFELLKQYGALKESKTYIGTAVNDDIKEKIEKAHEIVADKRLAQLTAAELDTLNEIADHLITVINNEVEMWVNGVKTKVNDMGKAALKEQHAKGMKGYRPIMQGVDKIGVMNLKPIYFFEKVGGTIQKLWNDILGGQDRYVRNMQYAQQRFSDISKKYHLDKWTDDKPLNFKTAQGHEISLTRGQALLVWATWKREGIAGKDSKHIFEGGIVYPDAVEKASDKGKNKLPKVLQKVYEDGTAHRLRLEDMLKIDEWLTKEQKAYADELVSFLSNDVAGWGNEISMQLYGINKFNEKYYIPFNSAGNYLYRGMGDEGTRLLKSEGFTKETQWGANNPLVVDDFTEVVVKHIERMSMYNSMVIPLDNFSRVWNYQERADADSNDSHQNVKAAFETAWGKEYTKYVNDLLRDINGGVMNDSRELGNKWISKFKKSAVMASASVMIQQPSAVGRAFSEINPVYFAKGIGKNMLPKVYEECKRYAPVAVLKEIGGFDTVGGQSMADWLMKREYKGKKKIGAFLKDSQYRDDIISYGPAWADRVTWAHIWLACKNEVKHKGYEGRKGLTGEALLEAAGKRFTEVINKTQVYDSVLSRSGIMRSTNKLAKMQTAFMAEPTTSLNMLMSAMSDLKTPGKRGNAVKKVAAVATAQVINSLLVSLVKAARDDDDEKDFWEVYWGETVSNFLDGINPLTMIPLVKDIFSLFMGYSIERSDMTIFSNFVDSINAWRSDKKTLEEKITGTMGSIADMFGIPLKNLMRDIKAVANVYRKSQNESDFSWAGAGVEIKENSFPILKALGIVDGSKDELLYDAWVNGNEAYYDEYASQYKSGSAIKTALKKQILERYETGKLSEEKAAEQLRKLGYSENETEYELRSITEPVEEEDGEDKNADFFTYEGIEGIQSAADAERDEERKEAEEEGKEYSEDSDYTWLRAALENGDKSEIQKEIDYLKDNGVSESKINSAVKSWIKENDGNVINLAESYAAGDLTGFESKVSAIASKYGVEPSAVAGAVRSAAGYDSREIEGTVYALSDLHVSIENSNGTQSKMIADAIIEAKTQQYINEGDSRVEAEKAAIKSVKQSLTTKWKEIYQKSDPTTRAEIQRQLANTGVWKKKGDIFELTRKWRQEWMRENQ